MKTNLINEEIKRVKLLMGYNSSYTLNENKKNLKIEKPTELDENLGAGDLKKMIGLEKKTATKVADLMSKGADYVTALKQIDPNAYKKAEDLFQGLPPIRIKGGMASSPDEILRAMHLNKLDGQALSDLASNLLKKGGQSLPSDVRKDLVNSAVDHILTDKRYIGLTDKEVAKLLKTKQFAPDIIDSIVKGRELKLLQQGGNKVDDVLQAAGQATTQASPGLINKMKQKVGDAWKFLSGNSKYGVLGPIAGFAGLAGLYYYFSGPVKKNFPDCFANKILSDEAAMKEMIDKGLEQYQGIINDPNNPDLNGAIIMSTAKWTGFGTIILKNGKSGIWQTQPDDTVKISVAGKTYNFTCGEEGGSGDEGGEGGGGGGTGGGCTSKGDFPFGYYQTNPMVGDVQKCVGASLDNCMGPQTAGNIMSYLALGSKPTELTRDIYDKVMNKCKGVKEPEKEKMKEPEKEGGDTSTETI